MSRRQRTLPLAAAAAVAILLAGCGATPDPAHRVRSATDTTLARTAAAHLVLAGATAFGPTHRPVLAGGAFVFPTGLGFERIDLPKPAREKQRRAFLVLQPNRVYLEPSLPPGALLAPGRSWISAPLAGPGSLADRNPRLVLQVEGLNPRFFLDELRWGSTAVTNVGERVVNHVPLSHYRVTISLPRVLASAHGPAAAATKVAVQQQLAALGGPRSIRLDVWVDGPGRVVKLAGPVPGSGLGTVTTMLFSFGATIAGSPPTASGLAPAVLLTTPAETTGWPLR